MTKPTKQELISATLIWAGGVEAGDYGYVITEEIFEGIKAIISEYLRLIAKENRISEQARRAAKLNPRPGRKKLPDDKLTKSTQAKRRSRAKKAKNPPLGTS